MPLRMERLPCTLIWEEPWEPGVVDEAAYSFLLSFLRPFNLDECYMTPLPSRLEFDGYYETPVATYCLDAQVVELW